jgi:glycosyltransferase involved in cell wall biosynthesis
VLHLDDMSPRPKVLHLRVAAGTGGGPEKTILHSPRFIKAYGYDAQVVYLCPPNEPLGERLRRQAIDLQCTLTTIDDRGPLDLSVLTSIVRLCKRERIDILQTHDYKSNAIGLMVRRFHRCRMVTMLHGWTDMTGRMPLYKKIDQWCLPKYEAQVCVSEDLVAECERLKIPSRKIHLVHNAIDSDSFRRMQSTRDAKVAANVQPERFLIGSVGRLSPEKCFSELIETVAELQRSGYAIDLAIAGDGPQREYLIDQIARLGCNETIRLIGQVEDTRPFYQTLDLFVLNSSREGLPNVLLEAMSMEVPIIATRVGGVASLVREGLTGRLIESGDRENLKSAILEIFLDARRRAAMAEEARAMIESQFSFSARMKKIANIYDALLDR